MKTEKLKRYWQFKALIVNVITLFGIVKWVNKKAAITSSKH